MLETGKSRLTIEKQNREAEARRSFASGGTSEEAGQAEALELASS